MPGDETVEVEGPPLTAAGEGSGTGGSEAGTGSGATKDTPWDSKKKEKDSPLNKYNEQIYYIIKKIKVITKNNTKHNK